MSLECKKMFQGHPTMQTMNSRDDIRESKVPVPRIDFLNSRDVPRIKKIILGMTSGTAMFLSLEFNF